MRKVIIIRVLGNSGIYHIRNIHFNLIWYLISFRDFVFWYVPQIQYKNPNIQIVSFKEMTPSPFIRCFYGTYCEYK